MGEVYMKYGGDSDSRAWRLAGWTVVTCKGRASIANSKSRNRCQSEHLMISSLPLLFSLVYYGQASFS